MVERGTSEFQKKRLMSSGKSYSSLPSESTSTTFSKTSPTSHKAYQSVSPPPLTQIKPETITHTHHLHHPTGDDICGLSLSIRFGGNLISIWHRDGTNEKSVEGIKTVVLEKISPQLIPQQNHIYHKIHASHPGFDEAIAKNKEAEKARSPLSVREPEGGKVDGTEVKSPEAAAGKASMDNVTT